MDLGLSTWSQFKTICITTKNLNCQYADLGDAYRIVGPDANGILWVVEVLKLLPDGVTPNPDATDFQANFQSSCNSLIIPLSSSVPAVDPTLIDSREGVFQVITALNSTILWSVPYPFVQLYGVRVDFLNIEQGDFLDVDIGYLDSNSKWVQVEWYANNYCFAGGNYNLISQSAAVSAPIPAGLSIRFVFTYANPQSIVTKPCAINFLFWRPNSHMAS